MDETKRYVVAVRPEAADAVPADWQGTLARVRGVTIEGSGDRRVQLCATSDAIDQIGRHFGRQFRIEEVSPRSFAP